MRSRRTSAEHQQAVASRLAALGQAHSAQRERERYGPLDPAGPGGQADVPGPDGVPAAEVSDFWHTDHTRVTAATLAAHRVAVAEPAPVRPSSAPAPEPLAAIRRPLDPSALTPGRHSARRAALVPDTLRGRLRLSPSGLTVVAILVALALGVLAWRTVRADPGPAMSVDPGGAAAGAPGFADAPSLTGEQSSGAAAPDGGVGSSGEPVDAAAGVGGRSAGANAGSLTVDVAGKVRRPGIAVLPSGSRVVDALEAAGGARRGVDLSSLNLARPLLDGEQILVGVAGATPVVGAPGSTDPSGTQPGALVNINQADAAALEELPEVGPVTAAAIIAWREQNGGFSAVEELLEVDGIGEATLAQLTPHVTI